MGVTMNAHANPASKPAVIVRPDSDFIQAFAAAFTADDMDDPTTIAAVARAATSASRAEPDAMVEPLATSKEVL